jgi:uncharacterized protein (TIGR04255 family)
MPNAAEGGGQLMPDQTYKRPPITEAVIEIRFAEPPIDAANLDKASARFASAYPFQQPVKNVNVAVGIPPGPEDQPTAQIREQLGHRLSSTDLSEILLLWPWAFVVSQLAPYPGWDIFLAGSFEIGRLGRELQVFGS